MIEGSFGSTFVTMKVTSVSELKAHLSQYLRRVRDGERILILARDEPIAELGPAPGEAKSGWERLARAGRARLGSQDWESFRPAALGRAIPIQDLLQDVREDGL